MNMTLFDSLSDPMVRTTDPETSRVAALTLDPNPREIEVLDALRYLCCAGDTHDIARVLAGYGLVRPTNTIARRLTSLERKGLVRRCGVKVGPYGKPGSLWQLVQP